MDKSSSAELLLPHSTSHHARSTKRSLALVISLFALLSLLAPSPLSIITSTIFPSAQHSSEVASLRSSCSQAEPIMPSNEVHNVSSVWGFKDKIIEWHQGLIRIPTEVYDEMDLEKAYPLFHKNLKRTKVDTYGLIFEWFGTDESLQPLMLTAHQDVVPVLPDTVYQWEESPWNGTYDGTYIWGRGSNDDKSGLTSIIASIELLLSNSDFKPRRTIVLGFGHDEERGGQRGAPAIRDWMLENYGPNSISLLIDEGSGIMNAWGRTFGAPAVAEKGKFNLNLTISTLGGHSSVPPKHTNIGLTSLLVAELERNPHPIIIEKESPIWGYLQCAASYAPDMPKALRKRVVKGQKDAKAFKSLPEDVIEYGLGSTWSTPGMGDLAEALMSTTQAADIIYGGVKINALPEVVTVMVNHRVNIASSTEETAEHIYNTLLPAAKSLNLAITGFGESHIPSKTPRGHIFLSEAYEHGHGPAPISPTDLGTEAWKVLAGTARGMWASRPEVSEDGSIMQLDEEDELVMTPYMGTGNTDTRRYWDLTRNIYRWAYFPQDGEGGAHTINERVPADTMVEFVRWFQAIILNVDANTEM